MQRAVLAAAAVAMIAVWLPAAGLTQAAPPPPNPSAIAAETVTDQLNALSARIDRYLARGQLSQAEAVDAHRQVNAIQDQASADREDNGGQITDAERFDLKAKIETLNDVIHRERAAHGGAPAGAAPD